MLLVLLVAFDLVVQVGDPSLELLDCLLLCVQRLLQRISGRPFLVVFGLHRLRHGRCLAAHSKSSLHPACHLGLLQILEQSGLVLLKLSDLLLELILFESQDLEGRALLDHRACELLVLFL